MDEDFKSNDEYNFDEVYKGELYGSAPDKVEKDEREVRRKLESLYSDWDNLLFSVTKFDPAGDNDDDTTGTDDVDNDVDKEDDNNNDDVVEMHAEIAVVVVVSIQVEWGDTEMKKKREIYM